jgi:mono/diheme cytochrome c family protein
MGVGQQANHRPRVICFQSLNVFDTTTVNRSNVSKLNSIMRTKRIIPSKLTAAIAALAIASSVLVANAQTKIDKSKLPPAADKKEVTYAADIKPIFEKSCVKCHGAEKPKARLRLDNLEGALKGGDNGKVIEAGKSADSVLVHNVAWLGDEDYFMPPKGNKAGIAQLTKEEVGLIRAWIDQGAK